MGWLYACKISCTVRLLLTACKPYTQPQALHTVFCLQDLTMMSYHIVLEQHLQQPCVANEMCLPCNITMFLQLE